MPRSDTSGHLVPDTKCVQLLKLNNQLPVVYGCLGDFQPFPISQDLVNHPIETTIDDKWFFQVPGSSYDHE